MLQIISQPIPYEVEPDLRVRKTVTRTQKSYSTYFLVRYQNLPEAEVKSSSTIAFRRVEKKGAQTSAMSNIGTTSLWQQRCQETAPRAAVTGRLVNSFGISIGLLCHL